jgi:CRP/FNR family transcriptional regulator
MQIHSLKEIGRPIRLDRSAFSGGGLVVRLPARSLLCDQTDRASSTFEVVEGAIMVSRHLADGRRQIVDILGRGQLCGRVLSDAPLARFETLVPSVVRVTVGAGDYGEERIARELSEALARSWEHAVLLGRRTAYERVASGLSRLASVVAGDCESDEPVVFRLPLTRGEMADWLGVVLETVSRNLGHLKRQGLIVLSHQDEVTVPDLQALRAVAAA